MKVEVERDKMLANYEVYEHLVELQKANGWDFTVSDAKKETKKRKKRKADGLIDLEIITKDLSKYLCQTGQQPLEDTQMVIPFMLALNKYKLEKAEKLQILNLLPRTMVVLYAIIEDCDQRFSEQECEKMIELVDKNFPVVEKENMDVDETKEDVTMADDTHISEEEESEMFEDVNGELEHELPTGHKDDEKEIDE